MSWGKNEDWQELLKVTKIVADSVIDWKSLEGLVEQLPLLMRSKQSSELVLVILPVVN